MVNQMRLKLSRERLQVYLANHYTTQGVLKAEILIYLPNLV